MRHDFEVVLTAVLDWLTARADVDPQRIVLVGRSFAGYLAPAVQLAMIVSLRWFVILASTTWESVCHPSRTGVDRSRASRRPHRGRDPRADAARVTVVGGDVRRPHGCARRHHRARLDLRNAIVDA
jgi:hypothetical protein